MLNRPTFGGHIIKTSDFCFVIHPCWDLLPVVAHPGPPRVIIDNEAGRADARPLLFYTASALEQARLAGYKTTTPDFRQALHCRDSVGVKNLRWIPRSYFKFL